MGTGQRTVNGGSGHGKVNQHQEVSGSVRKWATDTSPFLRNSIRAAVEAEAKPGRKTVATCSCSLMNSHSGFANILSRVATRSQIPIGTDSENTIFALF